MMKLRTTSRALLTLFASLLPTLAFSAAFTAGNVVIYRAGDGVAALSSASAAVFLDEYTPAGVLVQSIALPTAAADTNKACTAAGSSTSEGLMTLSADGKYLIGTCYNAAPATLAIAGTTSAATNRVVFRVDGNGVVDTTTSLSDFETGGNPRGAASVDGSAFWITGSVTGTTGGVHYAAWGATTSTSITAGTNLRAAEIYAGQLYVSASSGTPRIATVGTGLPTTGAQTITNLPGDPTTEASPYEFVLLDLSGDVAGVDTMYVADDTSATGGIIKYSLVAGSWVKNGTIGPGSDSYRGLTASVSAGTVTLFAAGGGKLVTVTDTAGYNVAPSTTTTTALAVAGTNTAFRGLAFVPTVTSVITPTLTVTAPATPIAEGNTGTSTATFTVSLDHPAPAGGVSFTINTADGSATAGSDYVAIVSGSGSIAAGQSSTTFNVTINGDTVHEGDETFSVNLSLITNTTNSTAMAVATIVDDDPQPTISVNDASVLEGNSGDATMNFAVTLSNPSVSDVSFTAQTQDAGSGAGFATAGTDYDALPASVITIPAGQTSGMVSVTVHGDTDIEPDEVFSLALSAPSNGTLNNTSATGTITNDDAVTPTFSINNVTQNEGDTGTSNFAFTVSSNVAAPVGGYTLNIATADGSATAGQDYVAVPGTTTITIPEGATSAPFNVVVNGDHTIEPDETFSVTLEQSAKRHTAWHRHRHGNDSQRRRDADTHRRQCQRGRRQQRDEHGDVHRQPGSSGRRWRRELHDQHGRPYRDRG